MDDGSDSRSLSATALTKIGGEARPCLAIALAPLRVVAANGAAQRLLGATTLADLSQRVLQMPTVVPSLRRGERSSRRHLVRWPIPTGLRQAPVLFALQSLAGRIVIATALDATAPTGAIPPLLSGFRTEVRTPEVSNAEMLDIAPTPSIDAPLVPPNPERPSEEQASVRFLWKTAADGRLTGVSDAFCERLGCSASPLGQSLVALAHAEDSAGSDRLAAALERGDTWSGIEVLWHAPGGWRVPVAFGGLPAFASAGQFDGFRGFGVIHFSRATQAVPAGPEPRDCDSIEHVAPAEPDAAVHSSAPLDRQRANVVHLHTFRTPYIQPMTMTPPPAADAGENEPGVALSLQERDAFREIARMLGAQPAVPPGDFQDAVADESEDTDVADAPAIVTPATIADALPAHFADSAAEQPPLVESVNELSRNAPALLDRLPIGVLVSRMDVPIYMNRTLLDILDYTDIEQFYAQGSLDHLFRGRHFEDLADVAGGGAIPIVTRNGDVLAVDGRVQATTWEGDAATLMTFRRAKHADLTARMHDLERDLRRNEAEARESKAILDTATDGVIVLTRDGNIASLNKSAEALFGYEQQELTGKPFTSVLARDSHVAATSYLAGLQGDGVASLLNDGRQVFGRARQGGSIPMFMTLGRLDAAGEKFCAVLRDMSEWKRAERELDEARRAAERASALKSDFLARVSHEIRTPLNAILGFAEVISDERFGPVGNERYKDYLRDIHASGVHVMSLVNDLLDLSKIESGKIDLAFQMVDVNRIVSESVALMQPQANRERIIVRMSLVSDLPPVMADERSLRQIVVNLVSNAVKFNEPGGQVIVSTALTDTGYAVVRVKDTGIGMTEEETQIALEPFRQIATTRANDGTGLGLPITKALVDANHASFMIRSRKNEGTLVEVAFAPARQSVA